MPDIYESGKNVSELNNLHLFTVIKHLSDVVSKEIIYGQIS